MLFNARGHWVDGVAPSSWRTPEDQLHSDQFFAVVDICVQKLPPKTARVFSMKEFLECEADEVCDTLGLSKADYWQCMSRARKRKLRFTISPSSVAAVIMPKPPTWISAMITHCPNDDQ